jgi:site-specific recombinase XerD
LCSASFAALAPTTRITRRRLLEQFRDEHGDKGIATLGRIHVDRLISAKADKPGTALNFLVALRGLMQHAVAMGLRADDPTVGVRGPKFQSAGFYSWTEDDIAAFEAKHRQSKTGKSLAIPLHPDLQAVLEATPPEHLTFLVTRDGKPYDPDAFTHWFKRKCRETGLPARASVHGLRKAACRRLAEAGCSASIIASISGHASLREIARYTAAAEQVRLARQGIAAVTRTKIGKPAS